MSYRNLNIRDEKYKYSIGKTGIKIVYPNGTTSWTEKGNVGIEHRDNFIITPKMIVDYILGNVNKDPSRYFTSCDHDGKQLTVDPYKLEVENKRIYLYYCPDCLGVLEDDI